MNKKNIDLLHSPFYSSVFFNKKFVKVVSVMDLMYRIIPNYFHNNKSLIKNEMLTSIKDCFFPYKNLSNINFEILKTTV